MSLKDEILGEMILADRDGTIYSSNYEQLTREILKLIETKLDEKIQSVTDIIDNDSRLTIQGCQRLKGKKDAYEEMKEILK